MADHEHRWGSGIPDASGKKVRKCYMLQCELRQIWSPMHREWIDIPESVPTK